MNTLVIGDIHEPFGQEGAVDFCKKVYKKHKCKHVVFVGDIVDHHRISRHVSEPDAWGAVKEAEMAVKKLKVWSKAFPKADVILGNHDLIPKRQAKELGVPELFIKKIGEVYGLPWSFHNRLVLNDVLYLHNPGSGKYSVLNKAREQSMSVVGGHTHRYPGVLYFSNPLHLFFGMQVGCLADKESYAMRYADNEVTLGCGVVYSPQEAYFVPMDLGRK